MIETRGASVLYLLGAYKPSPNRSSFPATDGRTPLIIFLAIIAFLSFKFITDYLTSLLGLLEGDWTSFVYFDEFPTDWAFLSESTSESYSWIMEWRSLRTVPLLNVAVAYISFVWGDKAKSIDLLATCFIVDYFWVLEGEFLVLIALLLIR